MNSIINYSYSFDEILIKPKYSEIKSRNDILLNTKCIGNSNISLNIPIISSPMDTVTEDAMAIKLALLGGLGIIHRFQSIEDQVNMVKNVKNFKLPIELISQYINKDLLFPCAKVNNNKDICLYKHYYNNSLKDSYGKLVVGAAIGINEYERLDALIKTDVDIINIDTANGYNKYVGDFITYIKKKYPNLPIIAGNICTIEGFKYLADLNVDAIRIGIGNGSICSTRLETGIGMCQFSAILECAEYNKKSGKNIFIISDGGHLGKNGNKFKALCAGAHAVMLGRSLAATSESPGEIITKNYKKYKKYRGMASRGANISKQQKINGEYSNANLYIEGIEGEIEYKGYLDDIIDTIIKGIRSGMSYLGIDKLVSLYNENIEYTIITNNGFIETNTRL